MADSAIAFSTFGAGKTVLATDATDGVHTIKVTPDAPDSAIAIWGFGATRYKIGTVESAGVHTLCATTAAPEGAITISTFGSGMDRLGTVPDGDVHVLCVTTEAPNAAIMIDSFAAGATAIATVLTDGVHVLAVTDTPDNGFAFGSFGAGKSVIAAALTGAVYSLALNGLAAAPINVVAPEVTGTPEVGQELSCSTGTWDNDPTSFTYQWFHGGIFNPISGATSSTYTVTDDDIGLQVFCQVTAHNDQGDTPTFSNSVGPVPGAPVNVILPAITGTPEVGQVLSCSTGTWNAYPTPTYAYQWRRDGSDISGATSSTYTLVLADASHDIDCVVTATNTEGSTPATATALGPIVAAPANTVAPVASGTPNVGSVLSTTTGTWTGYPTPFFTYQWRRDGSPISGATASTYTLVSGDVGTMVDCEVTGTNSAGAASADSNDLGPVVSTSPPVNTVAPVVSGTATVGQVLSCTTGTWTGTPTPTYTYQWRRDGSDISGATSSTYTLVSADATHDIDCVVTGTNTAGHADAASNSVGPVAPIVTTVAFQDSATAISATITWPSVAAGDLAVLQQFGRNTGTTPPADVVPPGFTSIDTFTVVGTNAYRLSIAYKICDGTESGTITGMAATSVNNKILTTYRGDIPISNVSVNSYDGEGSVGTNISHVITSGSGQVPLVVLACFSQYTSGTPSTTPSGTAVATGVSRTIYLIYNSSPSDVTATLTSSGSNIAMLGSFYMAVT